MSQSITWICDCGCSVSAVGVEQEGWVVLSQPNRPEGDEPKLDQDFHFKTLKCLAKWVQVANSEIPAMKERARGLHHPRGWIISEKVPNLFV